MNEWMLNLKEIKQLNIMQKLKNIKADMSTNELLGSVSFQVLLLSFVNKQLSICDCLFIFKYLFFSKLFIDIHMIIFFISFMTISESL